MPTVTVDELKAMTGQTIGVSDWILVDQARIDLFAEATGDRQFIHVDPILARKTPFGGTVAHGFLTLSLIPVLAQMTDLPTLANVEIGVNYGGNKCRFITPVRSGKRVRGHFRLIEISEKNPGLFQQTMEHTIEIEGEAKPALVAEWIIQFIVRHQL
ncbi:MaoC family dehydratase [soil metagenome]